MQRHLKLTTVKRPIEVHTSQDHLMQRHLHLKVEKRYAEIHPTRTEWATDLARVRRLEERCTALEAALALLPH